MERNHRARLHCSMWMGQLITDKTAILNRGGGAEHFSAVLNRPADISTPKLLPACHKLTQTSISTDHPARKKSRCPRCRCHRCRSTVYKHGGDTLLRKLTGLFCRMWDEEVIPQQLEYASIIITFISYTEHNRK